jgi:hypothetical protein
LIEKLSLSDTRPGTIIDKVNELVDWANSFEDQALKMEIIGDLNETSGNLGASSEVPSDEPTS